MAPVNTNTKKKMVDGVIVAALVTPGWSGVNTEREVGPGGDGGNDFLPRSQLLALTAAAPAPPKLYQTV